MWSIHLDLLTARHQHADENRRRGALCWINHIGRFNSEHLEMWHREFSSALVFHLFKNFYWKIIILDSVYAHSSPTSCIISRHTINLPCPKVFLCVCGGGDVNANSWAVILFRVWNITFSSIIFRIYSLRAPTTKLYWTKCLESSVAVPSITKTHCLSESKEMCISSWFYNIKLFSVSYHKPLQHHNRRDTICSSPRSHQICFCSRGEHQAARSLRE